MKKLFLAFLLLLFGTIQVYADQFSVNPEKYQVIRSENSSFYVDKSSVKVVRAEPPFYAIDGIIIQKDPMTGQTIHFTQRFFYNMDKHLIRNKKMAVSVYNEQGMLLVKYNDVHDKDYRTKRLPSTPEWKVGDYLFSLAYGKPFSVTSKLDTPKITDKEFSQNPGKYIFAVSNSFSTFYINKSTVKEIQSESPYYAIGATTIMVDYTKDQVFYSEETYFYNTKDGSMKYKIYHTNVYNKKGQLVDEFGNGEAAKVNDLDVKSSMGGKVGDVLFAFVHQIPFTETITSTAKEV